MVLPREARRGEASVTDTHMFIHSFIHAHTRTVVDSWTSSYAAPFNATKFEVEFGGTVVATTSASPASPSLRPPRAPAPGRPSPAGDLFLPQSLFD